jgi:hypothetical protein
LFLARAARHPEFQVLPPGVCCPVHFISAQASAPADCSDSSHRSSVPWSFRLAFAVRSVLTKLAVCFFSALSLWFVPARRFWRVSCAPPSQVLAFVRCWCPVFVPAVILQGFGCRPSASARTETSQPGRMSKRSARSGFACSSVTSAGYQSCWCVALRVNSFLDRVLAST